MTLFGPSTSLIILFERVHPVIRQSRAYGSHVRVNIGTRLTHDSLRDYWFYSFDAVAPVPTRGRPGSPLTRAAATSSCTYVLGFSKQTDVGFQNRTPSRRRQWNTVGFYSCKTSDQRNWRVRIYIVVYLLRNLHGDCERRPVAVGNNNPSDEYCFRPETTAAALGTTSQCLCNTTTGAMIRQHASSAKDTSQRTAIT